MEFAAPKDAPRFVDAADMDGEVGGAAVSGPTDPAPGPPRDDTEAAEGTGAATPDAAPFAVAEAFAAPAGATWNRVSTVLVWHRRLILLGTALPVIVGVGILAWLVGDWPLLLLWTVPALAALVAGWIGAVAVQRSWGYAEGTTDFYLTCGIVVRQLIVVPYGRMQIVDVTANLLEQAFGIATVRVRTAATTADSRIPGLRLADAVVLRDRLAARSETFSTGL